MMYKTIHSLMKLLPIMLILMGVAMANPSNSQTRKKKSKKNTIDTITSANVSALKFRSIGPAFTSGRIADFAVNPENHSEYYVAVASGHVWKTINNGTTFSPVFDNYKSYSIGVVTNDPSNFNVIWIGTGENNHQRALGYGDGVYKSLDGGKTWKNMGLKDSRHIGGIIVHPNNSDIVYVAAEGSAWGPNGDRGLYKTTDGGKNWEKVLEISENTGVNCIVMDPRFPDVIYASSEQRRRHVHTKIGGGPESAIYKTSDGGKNWKKLKSGLPKGDIGGIGLAISPVNPDIIYAIIEAAGKNGGFFRSTNRGESWSKMSSYSASGQYYNEIYCDPLDVDKVYSTETVTKVTKDAGKTWKSIGLKGRHVDDHALWINPNDTKHFMIGGDGGIYETYDNGQNFIFKTNLPVTQFYRVAVDDSEPFYWVYGGTQDNNSYGGPNQSLNRAGVSEGEWVVTLGGDGFWQAIEPGNPDVIYSESQYGNIARYDKKSGETIDIKPIPGKNVKSYKWNWNTPFFISSHSSSRLYMAANKVFRSDDRGNSWEVISDDITSKTDRNTWSVMGRYWGVDAVVKDVSTSLFGMAVSLAESKVQEGLLYVGTDDGVISVTENNGGDWFQIKSFPTVPEYTYVSDILPSKFDSNVVFVSFDNRKRDDFKPYILKSTDKGKSWKNIAANLPESGTIHTIEQDFINPDLLFVGTEFSVFFSVDGGNTWAKLANGLPTIAVRDMTIQEKENDLVLATFGRGFYILDDYSPLRTISKSIKEKEAHIFPIADALMYTQKRGRYGQGSMPYLGKNPDFGATITYYLKESPKTLKQERKDREKKLIKSKEPIPIPTLDELKKENTEVTPYLIFTISDENGNIVRKINKGISKGMNRIVWDLRYSGSRSVNLSDDKFDPLSTGGSGTAVMPGKYFVSIDRYYRGKITHLHDTVSFNTKVLNNTTFPADSRKSLVAFQKKVAKLSRLSSGTKSVAGELLKRIIHIKQSINNTASIPEHLMLKAVKLENELNEILYAFNGQKARASSEEKLPAQLSINDRVGVVAYGMWASTSNPTKSMKENYTIVLEMLSPIYQRIKTIMKSDIVNLESEIEKYGAPITPGRLPEWIK